MKLLFSEKGALPLLLAVFLLVLQPLTSAPLFTAPGSQEHAASHCCQCSLEQADAGACGCAVKCCPCCPGPGANAGRTWAHPTSKDRSPIKIGVLPCGGSEDLSVNSPGIKLVLAHFKVNLVVDSSLFPEKSPQKPEKQSLQPTVPPPENAAS